MAHAKVCIVGYGRVGAVTARLLAEKGYSVAVFDGSASRVSRAREEGFEAHLADATSENTARRLVEACDVIATALPSQAAEKAVYALAEAGAGVIVDVSYVSNPLRFHSVAEKRAVKLFVDAGLAPGLTNMLVSYAVSNIGKPIEALVYVGGVSAGQDNLLGLVASWNMEDLLEEYTRPARARINGARVELNPIHDATRVEVPGVGVFDALPTDGLRTLLETLPTVPTMIEYTLRYPGHVELLRTLEGLGLLGCRNYVVEGCSISPRSMLARLLDERLPRSGDRVVLYVRVSGASSGGGLVRAEYIMDVTQEGLGVEVPVLTYLTGFMHAWFVDQAARGAGVIGVNPPESLSHMLPEVLESLRGLGVPLVRRVCYEEGTGGQ